MKSNSKWNLEPQGIMAQNIVTKKSPETPPPFKKISNGMVVLVSYLNLWDLIHFEKKSTKLVYREFSPYATFWTWKKLH